MVWGHDIPMTFYKDCPTQQCPNDINYQIPIKIIKKAVKAPQAKKLF